MSRVASGPSSFVFLAAKPGGGRMFGMRSARSERALAEVLRKDRLVLLRTWRMPSWMATERELTLKDHAALNTQLSQLLSRGVPLVEALEVTASVVGDAARARIERMRDLVASGSSFADACHKAGSFDTVTIAVYRAAEKTGDLAGATGQLAENARRRIAISSKVKTVMIYPAIVMTISMLAMVVMLTVIVPMIGESLLKSGLTMPWYSRLVVGAGMTIRDNWLLSLGAVGACLVALLLGRGLLIAFARLAVRRMPVSSDVVMAQELGRFFSVMAAMTRSGIPLADALSVSSVAVGHPAVKGQLERMQRRLVQGGVFRQLVDEVDALPLATRKLLIAADQAGDLESAFDALARDMVSEVDTKTQRLLGVLEPLLIVFMFVVIGSMVLAIMMPLMKMSSSIS